MAANELMVADVRALARDVLGVELRSPSGTLLPGAAPGAHIDITLPNGLVRQYSLTNAQGLPHQESYQLAVGRDANSRGGSRWVHEKLRVGHTMRVGEPRNLFAMQVAERKVLLLAGGIGITPLYAMARHCSRVGLDWEMVACARSSARLAYGEELREVGGERLRTHFDDEQGAPLDLTALLRERRWDGLYACGPGPMLDAVVDATRHWPAGSVHLERFKAAPEPAGERHAFDLVLARSGCHTRVEAHESTLDALERLGVEHPWSCREGLCGSCEAGVLEGTPLHRDTVLDEAQRKAGRTMMVCVSRCAGPRLVLDL